MFLSGQCVVYFGNVWFICFYQVCVLLSGLAFVSDLCMSLPSLCMFLFGFCVSSRFVYVSVWFLCFCLVCVCFCLVPVFLPGLCVAEEEVQDEGEV